jgi:hypothetical protein
MTVFEVHSDRIHRNNWVYEFFQNEARSRRQKDKLACPFAFQAKPESQKRALRRHHAQLRKVWVRRTLRHYFAEGHALSARRVGMYSKTPKICSCFMCGNPRRFRGELTIQERRATLDSDLQERNHRVQQS